MYFADYDPELMLIFIYQVPGVGTEFSLHVSEEVRWTKDMENLVSSQEQPQEGVESDEVVHMGVGNKDMALFQQVPR